MAFEPLVYQKSILSSHITATAAAMFSRYFLSCLLAMLGVAPAAAQLGPIPGIPTLSLGQPNGPARLGPGGVLAASLPTTLSTAQITATGVVGSISIGFGGGYVLAPPNVTLAVPSAGGTQAAAVVSSMGVASLSPVSGGLGYTAGQSLSLNGGACSIIPGVQVTSVSGAGAITGMLITNVGACGVLPNQYTMTSTALTGQGNGATFNVNWSVIGVTVTSGGSGYTAPPGVTFSASTSPLPGGGTANGTSNLVNVLALGTSGTSGSGIASQGAFADGSKIRILATGAPYTVPGNTSWLAMVQPGILSSQTLTLPTTPADGLILRISTAGAITALTLLPPVPAWVNGSALAANTGFEMGWDAASSTWLPFTGSSSNANSAAAPALNTVSNTYTASAAISVTDTFALINSSQPTVMTLAPSNINGHSIIVNNYGAGTATVSLTLGGVMTSVNLGQGNVLNITWNSLLATYLLNA